MPQRQEIERTDMTEFPHAKIKARGGVRFEFNQLEKP